MERTAPSNPNETLLTMASALVSRMAMAAELGKSFGGVRDLYQNFGYKKDLNFADYFNQYDRGDIAGAIIDRPVRATWRGPLLLQEPKEKTDTAFETTWKKLEIDLKLKSVLSRVDRLSGIGRYGVLVLGLDDVPTKEAFETPVTKGLRKLIYIKPFAESSAIIKTFETNSNSPRYGLPLLYTVKIATSEDCNAAIEEITVHWTRVVHVTDDTLESEVYGIPRLKKVFNRLYDLEKIIGGDAEMFWRGARPGFQGKVDKDFMLTPQSKKGLEDQFDEFEHNLRRFLLTEGVSYEQFQQQLADPSKHVEVQLMVISAVTGIPKRILVGSERGELSSAQDSEEWKTYIHERREDTAEPRIIRPLVERLIEHRILPEPSTGEWSVNWQDLFALSEKDKVEIGKSRALALKDYLTQPLATEVMPPRAALEFLLGLNEDQMDLLGQYMGDEMNDEIRSIREAEAERQMQLKMKQAQAAPAVPGKGQPQQKMIRTK